MKTPPKRARNARARRKPAAPMPTHTEMARALGALGGAARHKALSAERKQEIARSGGIAAAQNRRNAKVLDT